MKKEKKYVTVGLYHNPLQAALDCDILCREGLHAKVEDMDTIMNTSFYKDELGAARLWFQKKKWKKHLRFLPVQR
jgi:hypothetical protein